MELLLVTVKMAGVPGEEASLPSTYSSRLVEKHTVSDCPSHFLKYIKEG